MIDQLLERCVFPDAEHLVCAVSGGPDSLALLALASMTGRHVTAVHVDHGLREGSAADAAVVELAAHRFAADFVSKSVSISAGPNLEARARAARYDVLPRDVLTGHTADDQAETIVLNLLRGAGIDGLIGMADDHRPLLRLRRRETHELCRHLDLQPVHDESNDDSRFRRNRVRHELLPLIADVAQRDPVPVLLRQAELLRDDAELLARSSQGLDPTDAKALAAAPAALARRAVRTWLRANLDEERHPPDAAAVERVLSVARGAATRCDVVNGWGVARTNQRLRLQRATAED